MSQQRTIIVIPARMGSTRYPGKPFAMIKGQTMIERVWRLAKAVPGVDRVSIATDHEEIATHARGFGADVIMTDEACPTGSDRVLDAVKKSGDDAEIIFNFQGDAVLTPPWIIEDILREMQQDPSVQIASPMVRLQGAALAKFVEAKKNGITTGTSVVFDQHKNAMYFSKGLIPFTHPGKEITEVYKHIGFYGYRRATLERFVGFAEGRFEKVEKLEQLRALENGVAIRMVEVDPRGRTLVSIDRPEDVQTAEEVIEREGELI